MPTPYPGTVQQPDVENIYQPPKRRRTADLKLIVQLMEISISSCVHGVTCCALGRFMLDHFHLWQSRWIIPPGVPSIEKHAELIAAFLAGCLTGPATYGAALGGYSLVSEFRRRFPNMRFRVGIRVPYFLSNMPIWIIYFFVLWTLLAITGALDWGEITMDSRSYMEKHNITCISLFPALHHLALCLPSRGWDAFLNWLAGTLKLPIEGIWHPLRTVTLEVNSRWIPEWGVFGWEKLDMALDQDGFGMFEAIVVRWEIVPPVDAFRYMSTGLPRMKLLKRLRFGVDSFVRNREYFSEMRQALEATQSLG
ncbi:hypothetical protein DL96DRAFT_1010581 [Flagelloscypha sp. PMI_526]|nr:hypothetical protein DL96DRAFT_1010581 [Flagelloscypha sp. PMI_526]